MKIGDLVKFKNPTGEFPNAEGDLAIIVVRDEWSTVIEWIDGTRDDINLYMNNDPFSPYLDQWLEVINESR